jgi:hypothetical protein
VADQTEQQTIRVVEIGAVKLAVVRLGLRQAFTNYRHFRAAGFEPLL